MTTAPSPHDTLRLQWSRCLSQADLNLSEREKDEGKSPSHWVILARTRNDLGTLANDLRWQTVQGRSNVPPWTDDFSNLLSVFRVN